MPTTEWQGKPYFSLDAWCKETFQHKCYKVALNAHMTCPNRDGLLDTRGCIFCSAGGSGDFAMAFGHNPDLAKEIAEQLQQGIDLISAKLPKEFAQTNDVAEDKLSPYIIAYFQAYTNTYGSLEYLQNIFRQALSHPLVCGISIATRPDCLEQDKLDLLSELKQEFPDKFIWIELGLQTIHSSTARYIRRGYELCCFEEAMHKLKELKIPTIVHVILGLPGESREQMLETVKYLNNFSPFGVKLQLLHVLKNTDLAIDYEKGLFDVLEKDAYLELVVACLENLSPHIVVHRVTGDGPRKLLIAPTWSTDKRGVLNALHGKMRAQGAYQGRLYLPEK